MSNFTRTFGNQTSPIPLSYLDDNFSQLESTSTSTVTLAGASLVGFVQSGTGATPRTVQEKAREIVSITDFDTTAEAFAHCDANGRALYIPAGTHSISNITTSSPGFCMYGEGGHLQRSVLECSATSGPALRIKGRSPKIKGVAITSTSGRYAASVTDGHGIWFADDDASNAAVISRQILEDVYIVKQPSDGIHSSNGCELSDYNVVTVADCKRHGFVFDDGTTAGLTNKVTGPFNWTLRNTRAIECGGHGYVLGHPSQTVQSQNLIAMNLESLGCAYTSGNRIASNHYQVLSYTKGALYIAPDIEDQQYASTTTATTGSSRTGLASPSAGIKVANGRAIFNNPYFSSLTKSIDIGSSGVRVSHPQVFAGAYSTPQSVAFLVSVGSVDNVFIEAMSADCTGATVVVQTQSTGTRYFLDGKEYIGLTTTAGDFQINADGDEEVTITSGTLAQLPADFVIAKAQSDTAPVDTMTRIAFAGARDGATVTLHAKAGESITVQNATTSSTNRGIQLKVSPRILTGDDGDLLVLRYSSTADLFYEVDYIKKANGQTQGFAIATTSVNTTSGGTVSASNLIPAGSLVFGVSIRVTTLVTGATSIDVGDGTDADRWGATIAVSANTTTTIANFTITEPKYYTAATSVVLTANGSNFTAGAVRITVHYLTLSAAGS